MKGGYFPVPPVDSSQDIRSTMCMIMEEMGTVVEAHHHEVATAGQNEIATRFNTMTKKRTKFRFTNTLCTTSHTVSAKPRPLCQNRCLAITVPVCTATCPSKNGVNLFSGDKYAGLSEQALYYIGGVIKHAKAINAR